MVNYELALLAKATEVGYGTLLKDPRFDPSKIFTTINGRLIHDYIFSWWYDENRARTTPTLEDLKSQFGHIPIPDPKKVTHPVSVLLDILEKRHLQQQLLMVLPVFTSTAEIDPVAALEKMRKFLQNLPEGSSMHSVDAAESLQGLMMRNYALAQSKGGVIGLPYPWTAVNKATQGILPGDFILVYATGKTGKTLTCLSLMSRLFAVNNCRIAVLCGHEMSPEPILEQIGCYLAKVSLERYRQGTLEAEEETKLRGYLEALNAEAECQDLHSRIRVFDVGEYKGPEAIEMVIDSFKPDVLYFDAYYSADKPDWKFQHGLITKGSLVAKKSKVPIIVSWQRDIRRAQSEDSGDDDQADFSMTSAVITKPDVVIKLTRSPGSDIMKVSNPAGRRGRFDPFFTRFNPGYPMDIVNRKGPDNAGWAGDVS